MAMTSTEAERPEELQAPGYEIFIGILSILSLVNLLISVWPNADSQIQEIARFVDVPITMIFLADFANRLRQSHPPRKYFIEQRGWLDLLGSLPAGFKLFRIFRVVRVGRLLREYGPRNILRSFVRERADNALLVVMLLVLLVLEFGSMAVLKFEQYAPGANITTGGDALWWAFVSITTVGYGDKFPITPGGRLSAFFVLAAGVGLFGVLSGYLANFFLSPASADEPATPETDATALEATGQAGISAGAVAVPGDPASSAAEREETLRTLDQLDASIEELRRRLTAPPAS
jgi:voltage-gated potassium channel Kch